MKPFRFSLGLGLIVLAAALLAHALIPRYEVFVLEKGTVRHDRWTGRVEIGGLPENTPWLKAYSPEYMPDGRTLRPVEAR